MAESPAKLAKLADVVKDDAEEDPMLKVKKEQLKKVVESMLVYLSHAKEFLDGMDPEAPAGRELLFAHESVFLTGQSITQGMFQHLCIGSWTVERAKEVLGEELIESARPWLKTFDEEECD